MKVLLIAAISYHFVNTNILVAHDLSQYHLIFLMKVKVKKIFFEHAHKSTKLPIVIHVCVQSSLFGQGFMANWPYCRFVVIKRDTLVSPLIIWNNLELFAMRQKTNKMHPVLY